MLYVRARLPFYRGMATTTNMVLAPTIPAMGGAAAEPNGLRRNDTGRLALLALETGLPAVAGEIMASSNRGRK